MNKNSNKANNPRGLYTSPNDDKIVMAVFPQGEEIAYNHGRDEVRWDMEWFSGYYEIGWRNSGDGWKVSSMNISKVKETTIKRGRIYAAVKYNNKWKGCVIQTK